MAWWQVDRVVNERVVREGVEHVDRVHAHRERVDGARGELGCIMAVVERKRVRESSGCLEPSSACVWNGHECLEREKGELTKVARLGLSQGFAFLSLCLAEVPWALSRHTDCVVCLWLAHCRPACCPHRLHVDRRGRAAAGPTSHHLPWSDLGGRDEAAVDQLRRARADPTRGQCRADTSRDSRWCW